MRSEAITQIKSLHNACHHHLHILHVLYTVKILNTIFISILLLKKTCQQLLTSIHGNSIIRHGEKFNENVQMQKCYFPREYIND